MWACCFFPGRGIKLAWLGQLWGPIKLPAAGVKASIMLCDWTSVLEDKLGWAWKLILK